MTPAALESVYETLARKLDDVGEDKHNILLAKLVLLLSHDLDDSELICKRIQEAGENLDV